jgi:hypothetical protein
MVGPARKCAELERARAPESVTVIGSMPVVDAATGLLRDRLQPVLARRTLQLSLFASKTL